MALPKVKHPVFELEIPSTKAKIKCRPFLVKEEKVLLLAQESKKTSDMIIAVKQILNNCIIEGDVDVNTLPSFDIEFLFLRIRATSVDGMTKIKFTDQDTNEEVTVDVDLNTVGVKWSEKHNPVIDIGEGITMEMRYPTYTDLEGLDTEDIAKTTSQMINICTDKIYQGEEVHQFKDYTDKEIEEYIESLSAENFKDIQVFFDTMPKLEHTVEYNIGKKKKSYTFSGVSDFFSLA